MPPKKIVCDEKIPFLKGVFEAYADVVYLNGSKISNKDLIDADALITRTRTICNEELLHNSRVKIIASATIGYDHIDTEYCDRNSIKWTNAPGCNSSSVAQYIGSTLIYLSETLGFKLKEKTLGIVGVGNVGSKVNRLAKSIGMKTIVCDQSLGLNIDLKELIKGSDIITLHTPLTPNTFHFIDPFDFKNKILINSSRGPVVDNQRLKMALRENVLKACALDVWENEPEIDTELLPLLNIATPHIAGYSLDGKANGTRTVVREVSKVLNLPLIDWGPKISPVPVLYNLQTESEALKKALRSNYQVENDDRALRENPELFEKLRSDYPIRRENILF